MRRTKHDAEPDPVQTVAERCTGSMPRMNQDGGAGRLRMQQTPSSGRPRAAIAP